jgi:hypothetical protein
MKRLFCVLLALSLFGCYDEVIDPVPNPDPPNTYKLPPDPYCGDGVCDVRHGEDDTFCNDCCGDETQGAYLFEPCFGGYCGDEVCSSTETINTCFKDCSPIPVKPKDTHKDPGWIDPPRQ